MSDASKHFHETWLGMVQPTEGLVVSIPALEEADASERLPTEAHRAFTDLLEIGPDGTPRLRHPRDLLIQTLGWSNDDEPGVLGVGGRVCAPFAYTLVGSIDQSTSIWMVSSSLFIV